MIVLGYIVGFIALGCFWIAAALLFLKYDMKEVSTRLILVGIICAFITSYLLHDTIVSSACKQMAKRDGICEQKAKTKDTQ